MKTPIGKILLVVSTIVILLLVNPPEDEGPFDGSISGIVVDAEGKHPISEANVTLMSTGEVYCTDNTGRYEFGYIAPGYYKIYVFKQGYKPFTKKIRIISGETIAEEFLLSRSRS